MREMNRPFSNEEDPSRVPHTRNPLARETVKGTEFPLFPYIYPVIITTFPQFSASSSINSQTTCLPLFF